jgi:hypothetical protein
MDKQQPYWGVSVVLNVIQESTVKVARIVSPASTEEVEQHLFV